MGYAIAMPHNIVGQLTGCCALIRGHGNSVADERR